MAHCTTRQAPQYTLTLTEPEAKTVTFALAEVLKNQEIKGTIRHVALDVHEVLLNELSAKGDPP